MFGLQTVDNASSNSDTRKLHHIIQDSVKGYLWVTAADNLYAYKITDDASLDKVDLSRLLSADRKILTKILSDQSGNLWVTGYYPSSFIISFLPNLLPLSMEGVKSKIWGNRVSYAFLKRKVLLDQAKEIGTICL